MRILKIIFYPIRGGYWLSSIEYELWVSVQSDMSDGDYNFT